MSFEMELLQRIIKLEKRLARYEKIDRGWSFVPLTEPLTSTDFDGDSFSTTGKTKIDLSDKFGAPAGIKAIYTTIAIEDSDSNNSAAWFGLSPNDTAGSLAIDDSIQGTPNDTYAYMDGICPCDSNGDVYYQCVASGVGTLDVIIEIWGYWR
jgi:hypothetical protein